MPRKSTGKPAHRPLITIDWKRVDRLILSGLNGKQIAGILDVSPDTFYERFALEKGSSFSNYQPSRKGGGDGLILERQFIAAMNGNTAMLKLLGEERLGQGKQSNNNSASTSLDGLGEDTKPTFNSEEISSTSQPSE